MLANFYNNYSTCKELKPSVREYFLDPESWSKKNFGEFWNIDWRLWNKCKNEFNQGSPGLRGSKKLIDQKPSKKPFRANDSAHLSDILYYKNSH